METIMEKYSSRKNSQEWKKSRINDIFSQMHNSTNNPELQFFNCNSDRKLKITILNQLIWTDNFFKKFVKSRLTRQRKRRVTLIRLFWNYHTCVYGVPKAFEQACYFYTRQIILRTYRNGSLRRRLQRTIVHTADRLNEFFARGFRTKFPSIFIDLFDLCTRNDGIRIS